jgi:Tol biopolymer transport system component
MTQASGAVPFWSPDGRRLLLANDVRGSSIAIIDAASGTLTSIAGHGTSGSAAWQPRLP